MSTPPSAVPPGAPLRTHKRPRHTPLSTAWQRDELQLPVARMCAGREALAGRPTGRLTLASSFRRRNGRMMLWRQRWLTNCMASSSHRQGSRAKSTRRRYQRISGWRQRVRPLWIVAAACSTCCAADVEFLHAAFSAGVQATVQFIGAGSTLAADRRPHGWRTWIAFVLVRHVRRFSLRSGERISAHLFAPSPSHAYPHADSPL